MKGFFRTVSQPNKSAKVHGPVSTRVHGQMAPLDGRFSMVEATGHAWVRLDTARCPYWENWTRSTPSGTRLGSAEVPQIQFIIDLVVVVAECGCFLLAALDKSGAGECSLLLGTPNVIWCGLAIFWLQFRLGFSWLQ